jgi:hypothetical protein
LSVGFAVAVLVILFASGLVWAQEVETTAAPSLDSEVETIISGYRANRALFPFAIATMAKTTASARSLEDAIARRWLDEPEPVRSERRWVTDGITTRFDEPFPSDLTDGQDSPSAARIEVRN